MAKGDDIENRLVDFAVRIVHLSDNMPNKRSANHIAGQLLRSGTAPAALYAEARDAESPKDFQHKLKVCFKELNESRVWLKIVIKSKMVKQDDRPTSPFIINYSLFIIFCLSTTFCRCWRVSA